MDRILKIVQIPNKVVQIYLTFTVVLFILGPWDWKTHNPFCTYLLLFLYQASLYLGYKDAMKINKKTYLIDSKCYAKKHIVFCKKTIEILILFCFIITFFQLLRTININDFSINNIFQKVLAGILDPGMQYKESKDITIKIGGSLFTYFWVLTAPIWWMAFPISIYKFQKLSILFKVVTITMFFFEAVRWIAIGTNKGFFDILIIFFTVIFFKKIKNIDVSKINRPCITLKNKVFIFILGLVVLGLLLYVFSNNIESRVNCNFSSYEITNGFTRINYFSPLMLICPEILKPTLIFLSSYLTQGYYALSLCTSVDWKPTFGIGNSMFLMENFKDCFEIDVFSYTYQTRIEIFNWDSLVNWHSIYVWIANDVSLLGVIIVMYFLGRIFANVVWDVIIYDDNIALGLLCLMILMFLYFPANNQILSYPITFMAFWVYLIVWYFNKRIKVIIHR